MSETREKILDVTQLILQQKSYQGIRFQEVADKVGIRKASLYHYFRSKNELIEEVLSRARFRSRVWQGKLDEGDPKQKLELFLTGLGDILDAGTAICTGGACVFGWYELSQKAKSEALGLWEDQTSFVRDIIVQGQKECRFRLDADVDDIVTTILCTVQGGLLVSQANSDGGVYESSVETIIKLISTSSND